jgi:hypothetical protein
LGYSYGYVDTDNFDYDFALQNLAGLDTCFAVVVEVGAAFHSPAVVEADIDRPYSHKFFCIPHRFC